MSYTTFSYSALTMPEKAEIHDTVKVSVTVENIGKRAGYEVVQLYVTDKFCRITPFVKQLRGFEKLYLQPGEKKTVSFSLSFEDFSFVNERLEREVEPGSFEIRVGPLQAQIELK